MTTTATSLQGLVAQLANFETNFIHILTQAALRMSDLSGRELFLLVKSQAGTYFAGSRELCAAYKIGTLMPSSPNEVHIKKEDRCEVCAQNQSTPNAASSSPPESHPTPAPPPPPPPPPPSLNPPPLTSISRKRPAESASPQPAAACSSSSSSSSSSAAVGVASPAKKPNLSSNNHSDAFNVDSSSSSSRSTAATAMAVKAELQTDPNYAIALDDDDDDVIWEEVDAATSWAVVGQRQIQRLQANGFHFELDDSHQHFGFEGGAAANFDEARRYRPSTKELFEAKVERLKSLRPDEVFVKRSHEHQLLSTVMYGYGRDLALEFIEETKKRRDEEKDEDETKEKLPPLLSKANYFHKKYENFVLQFPELTGFKTKIKRSRNQIVSAAMYIKNIAQKAFYKRVKKEEDNDLLLRKAAEEGSGKGGGGGGGGGGGKEVRELGSGRNECSNSSVPSPGAKVELALINPITGFPEADHDAFDLDDDDEDIIFL